MHNMSASTLGTYRVLEQIGFGGMATVYKAYQPEMERLVAIKVLPSHYARDSHFVHRFKREAQIIAKLEHRNIIPVYDFGEQDGTTYLVMRYLQAGTIKDILAQGSLALADVAKLLRDVASALDYAHSQGIIHRDIKPSNILVDKQGNAYLTDFGTAKVVEATSDFTGSMSLGTPAYMAPEQTLGKLVSPQTDVYSLGAMLYEMVTGKPPFESNTPMATALMHVREPLILPRKLNADLSDDIQQIIVKALAKDPKDRYQSAGELATVFANAVGLVGAESLQASSRLVELASAATVGKGSEEVTYDIREEFKRHESTEQRKRLLRRAPLAIGVVMIVALVVATIGLWQQFAGAQTSAQQTATALMSTIEATARMVIIPASTSTPTGTLDLVVAATLQQALTQTAAATVTAQQATIQSLAKETQSQLATNIALTPTQTPAPTLVIPLLPTATSVPTPIATIATGTIQFTLVNICSHSVDVQFTGTINQIFTVPGTSTVSGGGTGILIVGLPSGVYDIVATRKCSTAVRGLSASKVSIPPLNSFAACTTTISCS